MFSDEDPKSALIQRNVKVQLLPSNLAIIRIVAEDADTQSPAMAFPGKPKTRATHDRGRTPNL